MRYWFYILCAAVTASLIGCQSGVRELDFVNKQFQVTYDLDSTRTIDSTQLDALRQANALYTFNKGGQGVSHIHMGMVSNNIPFTWSIKNDCLSIDQTVYRVRKQTKGFILVDDSVKLVLSQQP